VESKTEWIAVSENNGQIVEALNAAARDRDWETQL